MHALPAAPAPPPRRQVLVGTTVASVATIMVIGGMLAVWLLFRERALDAGETWLPDGVTMPEVPANIMLITFFVLCLFAQWAVHAVGRADRVHASLALGLTGLLGIAIINAQVYLFNQVELPIADSGYAGMFYAVTGTMLALIIAGVVFTAVTAFRVLGGRGRDTEIAVAHALFWYVLTAVFSAVWLVVFVTK
jgi:cytochrome c oxidase subunit 3